MTASSTLRVAIPLAALLALGVASCLAEDQVRSEPPAAAQPAQPTATDSPPDAEKADEGETETPKLDPDVERVLKLAEQAGTTVEALEAEFEYDLNLTLVGDREWRSGRMAYKRPSSFYVEFSDGAKEVYKFDGRVLVEDQPRKKKRQPYIFRQPTDPAVSILDIEELPFPHPFGQKRDMLLEHFEITYKGKAKLEPWARPDVKPSKDEPKDETEYEHLLLVPKKKSRLAKKYTQVEYWLNPGDGLVRQARSRDPSERIETYRFTSIKTNDEAKISDKQFEKGKLPSGWTEEEPIDYTKPEEPLEQQ